MTAAASAQADVRLPGDPQVDEQDIMLTNASIISRNFVLGPGKVDCKPADPLPPGALFVERAALVEHLYFEAQRLQPERCVYLLIAGQGFHQSNQVKYWHIGPGRASMDDVTCTKLDDRHCPSS